jgi:SpoIID/LytB domain protein
VGIVSGQKIHFTLNAPYTAKGETIIGEQVVEFSEGGILWNGNQYRELTFTPQQPDASFSLYDVTIGVNFHWERKETQLFNGTLLLVVEADKITAINLLPVEQYLISVISSEMSATSSIELLRAHAVISRSWLLAQMEKRRQLNNGQNSFFSFTKKEDEIIRWYDREDHQIFDVCADDHCQRYYGITKATNRSVEAAVRATRGQILMYEDEICDARYGKCCGGMTEEFQYCWEDTRKPYLLAIPDSRLGRQPKNLSLDENADQWIRSTPDAFCNTRDPEILSQVLNDYDQETTEFYRWHVEYSQEELSRLVSEKLNTDFGLVTDLVPLARGRSGRIWRLKIVGTEKTLIIGKELEIRRALSPSHLYSSAFVIDRRPDGGFLLTGAGWGHGVGLCQIGAAVMSTQGYNYDQILLHYYRGAEIKKIY